MEQKDSKIFSKETIQSVTEFCESQEIKDLDNFMYLCFKQGFDIKKYGFLGETGGEVTVEIIKEVEKIVEVIKEVPVEILVEKKIYTTDDTQINELLLKIEQLEEEFSTKTSEMENIFQNKMSKKDEELDELRRNLDKPPVEVIKEVEKPNDKMGMLQETLQTIRKELQIKNERIKELEKINRDLENINTQPKSAVYLRGSNLNSRI